MGSIIAILAEIAKFLGLQGIWKGIKKIPVIFDFLKKKQLNLEDVIYLGKAFNKSDRKLILAISVYSARWWYIPQNMNYFLFHMLSQFKYVLSKKIDEPSVLLKMPDHRRLLTDIHDHIKKIMGDESSGELSNRCTLRLIVYNKRIIKKLKNRKIPDDVGVLFALHSYSKIPVGFLEKESLETFLREKCKDFIMFDREIVGALQKGKLTIENRVEKMATYWDFAHRVIQYAMAENGRLIDFSQTLGSFMNSNLRKDLQNLSEIEGGKEDQKVTQFGANS